MEMVMGWVCSLEDGDGSITGEREMRFEDDQ
jgi:hypothetical protein